MISVNQRSALSCSGRLGVWRKLQQTLVLSCSLPLALTLLTLCLCPKGVACFVQAALLLCIDRCISAQQASGAGAVNRTDNRFRGGGAVCSGRALSPAPWKLHSFALGLNILGTSTSQILWDHFVSLREGQACRSHSLWI